jgi:sulfite reductase (NADPH) flavoprotein alpha-component
MTISIWRYSHLTLAVSSFLFLALASLTGIILAFEPISEKIQPYKTNGFEAVSVAEFISALKRNDLEIIDFSVDENQFIVVKAIDENGKNTEFYADARTGKPLGGIQKRIEFFEWVTNLHRSLFLHNLGRLFMGITAFLLLLIAISGSILVIQRQRGLKRFFTKVVKEDSAQYYHVVSGRVSLIVILVIALTGTYLSLVRFEVFADKKINHKIDFDAVQTTPEKEITAFTVFKNTPLSETINVEFPFSDDREDYFTLKTQSGEFVINQFTGEILSEVPYSKTKLFSELSLDLHTGRASAIWAVVLAIAATNILFFIYSGFAIVIKRRKSKISNKYTKEKAEFIVLVGSENGSTVRFADAVHRQLLKSGKKSFLTELNNYTLFPQASHFIILTSTYGLGNPPSNATKFLSLLQKHPQHQNVQFSVIGFGSHAYPDFCRFAFEANQQLTLQKWATPLLEIHTVNDKSSHQFEQWAKLLAEKSGTRIQVPSEILNPRHKNPQQFTVLQKTGLSHEDGAFLMTLQPKTSNFKSGDLLTIFPANDHRERQYSIGKIGSDIQISVKHHLNGLGSNYLFSLQPGDTVTASVTKNPDFHFPKKAPKVILICNGTGIAPFLGMIDENKKKIETHLYCGFRGKASFDLYKDNIQKSLEAKRLSSLAVAYSREGEKQYVKDILAHDAGFINETLQNDGFIMICGSLAMQQNIVGLLETICVDKTVAYYQSRKQILMDCY